jgi:hypothetical protein
MTSATVKATVTVTSKPGSITRTDGSVVAFATARQADDPSRWELFGLSEGSRSAIGRLKVGDIVKVAGPIAPRIEGGVLAIKVNVLTCALHTSTPPAAKCGARGTRLATRAGVEAADRDWRERNQGTDCASYANPV